MTNRSDWAALDALNPLDPVDRLYLAGAQANDPEGYAAWLASKAPAPAPVEPGAPAPAAPDVVAENARLRQLIRDVEWRLADQRCPWCSSYKRLGHAPTCPAFPKETP